MRNQRGRFMGTKRKLILLRERKQGGYTVQSFQCEMTPAEHLQWFRNVASVIRSIANEKTLETAATSEPPKQHFTKMDSLGPILSPKKYEKRRKKLLKELATMMAKDRKKS